MSDKNMQWGPWLLLIGDLLAITLFVFLGQQEHSTTDAANPFVGLLRTSSPFLITWVVVAWSVGAVPRHSHNMNLRYLLLRGLNAWLIAAPISLMLRAFLFDRGGIPAVFMLVTLGAGGAIVLSWRLLFGLIWGQISRRASAAG